MTTQQPEALRLAEHLENFRSFPDDFASARELRRQHARIVELETQLAKVTHPAQQGVDPIEQRQLAIGQAVERACKELPEGAEIQIYLERGAGTVHMTDWDGNEFDHFDEAHNDFACRINAATDGAIAAEKVAAQAKQGEQTNG